MIAKMTKLNTQYLMGEIEYEEYKVKLEEILKEYEEMRKSENSSSPGGNN